MGPLLAALALAGLLWLVGLPLGLGRALLGSDPPPPTFAALALPGLALLAVPALTAARRAILASAPRWHPGQAVPGLLRPSETLPDPAPSPPIPTTPLESPPLALTPFAPAPPEPLVALHPRHSPAWAAWALRWTTPLGDTGLVPLPPGARLVLGRDPECDVVVALEQVSWHHLELDAQEARVTAYDLGSSNGTRPAPDAPPHPAHAPIPWAPGEPLHLAAPVALTLSLEALR